VGHVHKGRHHVLVDRVGLLGWQTLHKGPRQLEDPAVRDRDRVPVHVDDPGRRVGRLGDLMDVSAGRDAGADVEELGDALVDHEADGAAQERAVGPHHVGGVRRHPQQLLGHLPVHVEMVRDQPRPLPRTVSAPYTSFNRR
jgi:hypothetical protein